MFESVGSGRLDFTAIDFETANRSRASVCAMSAVKVRGGRIVEERASLVTPPEGHGGFEAQNTRVHGIDDHDVAAAPPWPLVYADLLDFIGDDVVVGHNVRFDISVVLAASSACDLPWPDMSTLCTLELARSALQLPSYSLPWVADHLGLGAFEHHDPLADARMTALTLCELSSQLGATSLRELAVRAPAALVPLHVDESEGVLALVGLASRPDAATGSGFQDQAVCFTGALKTLIRSQAHQLVADHGGVPQPGVSRKTNVVVTGDFDTRTFRPNAEFSAKLEKAFKLVAAGQNLEIITEDEFIARLALSEDEFLKTVSQMGGGRSTLPEYIRARPAPDRGVRYWDHFRAALRHPSGRSNGGQACVWCAGVVPSDAHWIHRDRHVCSVRCNERLKRSAHRHWSRSGG